MRPKVHMVSAGPGDSDLLTLGAKSLLESADLIAYDDLIHPDILSHGSAKAVFFPIGYRGKPKVGPHPILHPHIVEAALKGQTVVRLKGGDASMFSRIYQEWQYLAHFGIEITISAGVSAAFAAAAKAAIPLTRKGVCSQVSFEWCHSAPVSPRATRVVYMPRSKISAYCRRLVAMGYSPNTPAYFVTSAGTPLERSYYARLTTLPASVNRVMDSTPGIVIIGDVAKQSMKNQVEQSKPLTGKRIVLLRLGQGISRFTSQLKDAGADVIQAPLVQHQASDYSKQTSCDDIQNREDTPWIFTTPESVHWFFQWLNSTSFDIRKIRSPLFCIGHNTSQELRSRGMTADMSISGYQKKSIDASFGQRSFVKMIVFTGEGNRFSSSLETHLSQYTKHLEKVRLYKSRYSGFRIVAPPPDFILAPSRQALIEVDDLDFGSNLKDIPVLALGDTVQATAIRLGYQLVKTINFSPDSPIVDQILSKNPTFVPREIKL